MTFKNQKEMFDHIWETREHVSDLSGKPLLNNGHSQFYWQFLHVLSKGCYPGFKLREENIMLALPDEHERQEEFEDFLLRRYKLRQMYYAEFYGKKFD